MGAGWAGMKGGSANGVCPVCLLGGCGLVLGRGGTEKGVGCGARVSPGLDWCQYVGSGVLGTAVHGSIVVDTANPHR